MWFDSYLRDRKLGVRIGGLPLLWFDSYLSDRKLGVRIGGLPLLWFDSYLRDRKLGVRIVARTNIIRNVTTLSYSYHNYDIVL